MKHKELIQAALDGKIIQFKYIGSAVDWAGWRSPESAITWLAGPGQGASQYEVRIQPPELPKKVHTLYLVGDQVYLYRNMFAVDAALQLELPIREVKITVQDGKIISTEEVK